MTNNNEFFEVAGQKFSSRLLVGTGKYKDMQETANAIKASGAEIVTVAVRRVNIEKANEPMLQDFLDPKNYTYLPNTAGCFNAEDALRTLRLAREVGGWNLVKLEVLADQKTLYPNVIETVKAAKTLIGEGFEVMAYTSDDPIVAKELEDIGCCAIMPLGAPIGSGLGLQNKLNIQFIIEQSNVGVGVPSEAAEAMEMGCDAVLVNSAIAHAKKPILMAEAMKLAVESGRKAFLAGRMPKKDFGVASSPEVGLIKKKTA